MAMDTMVDTVVIATESARSALHRLHHQPENPPPGEVVTMRSMTPYTRGSSKAITEANPRKGRRKNWHPTPVPVPL